MWPKISGEVFLLEISGKPWALSSYNYFQRNMARETRTVDEFQKSQNIISMLKVTEILMIQIKSYQICTQPNQKHQTCFFQSFK